MAGLYDEQFEPGEVFRQAEHRGYNQRDEVVCICERAALMKILQ